MSTIHFSDASKRNLVAQITEWDYPVASGDRCPRINQLMREKVGMCAGAALKLTYAGDTCSSVRLRGGFSVSPSPSSETGARPGNSTIKPNFPPIAST